ncbi:MAG: hypothetical protein IJO64_03085 [Clostridia bacterium]|nr:hypothetical protein [Clostridia bacterium]
MTKQEICQPIYDKYNELSIAMQGEDLELIKRLALELHSLVHPAEVSELAIPTIADTVFEYMRSRGQNLLVPREDYETDLHYAGTKTVPLCWYFWHIYRIEDIVSNVLMANQDQIFNSEWQRKINSSITDTGNALEFEETVDFGQTLNIDALYEYMVEVAKNTRNIIKNLSLDQIKSMVPEEWVMRILEEGGVTTDFRSVWLLVFWGRLTRGGMILTPLTAHHMMHLPACLDKILNERLI